MTQLDEVTQQNAAMFEEATQASHVLSEDAAQLGELVACFRLSGTAMGSNVVLMPKAASAANLIQAPLAPKAPRLATADGGWQEF